MAFARCPGIHCTCCGQSAVCCAPQSACAHRLRPHLRLLLASHLGGQEPSPYPSWPRPFPSGHGRPGDHGTTDNGWVAAAPAASKSVCRCCQRGSSRRLLKPRGRVRSAVQGMLVALQSSGLHIARLHSEYCSTLLPVPVTVPVSVADSHTRVAVAKPAVDLSHRVMSEHDRWEELGGGRKGVSFWSQLSE